ncbi:MAG TPA: S9 family peptidase, partial [Pirellulales bacterium]
MARGDRTASGYRTALAGLLGGLTLMTLSGSSGAAADKLQYPAAPRGEVVDELHGVKVADPYRWLEDDVRVSADSAKWVEDENRITFGYLDSIPERPAIRAKLESIWNYERFSAPTKRGDYYFYSRNDGLQNQSIVYVATSLEAPPEVLLDPNTWTKDGTA